MTAAFNAQERGDSIVANPDKTSDTPQFDLKSLYSDMNSTLAGNGSARESTSAGQIDFGTGDKLYSSSANADNNSPERQGAMAVARAFSSFDNGAGNAGGIKLDAQDVLNGVQVLGDMDYVQQSLNQGNTADAKQWLGELKNDMTAFQKGLFTDGQPNSTGSTDSGQEQQGDGQHEHHNHERHGHHGRHHDSQEGGGTDSSGGSDSSNSSSDSSSGGSDSSNSSSDSSGRSSDSSSGGSSTSDNCSGSSCPPENSNTSGDSGNESGSENHSAGTDNGGTPGDSSAFTPQDTMVLIGNDMQQLSQALAGGDTEKAQQIMAQMERHMTNLMMQLNPNASSGGDTAYNQSGTDGGTGTGDQTQPASGDQSNFNPLDPPGFLGRLNGILNPSDLANGLQPPNPGDILSHLPIPPTPQDILGSLPKPPNPQDILGSLPKPPNPQEILGSLPKPPNPSDILGSLPKPPNPQDILGSLPKPPNPQDLVNDLPQLPGLPKLPNPGNLLSSLPSPGDLFHLF